MIKEKPYIKKVRYDKSEIADLSVYPYSIPFLKSFDEIDFHEDVTIIVGENGSGKSTLIEAIAMALGFSAEGGNKNFNVKTADTISNLFKHLKISQSYKKPTDYYFLRAESFFNVATYMDEVNYLQGYGGKSLHEQSHGESFMALLNNKLRGKGLYIFDEPEAALSPLRQLTAVSSIHSLVQQKSQFIIATHSPIIMAYPNAKIYMIDDNGIQETKFEDTEHYQVYELFFKDYKSMIERVIR